MKPYWPSIAPSSLPFDHSQMPELISVLDDTFDLMMDTGQRMSRYGIGSPQRWKAWSLRRGPRWNFVTPMSRLSSVDRNVTWSQAMSLTVRRFGGEVDDRLDRGPRALFEH